MWIDLHDPTPEETAQVEHELGIRVPTEAALNEIESSSRVYSEHGAMYLSMPMIGRGPDREPVASPLGFVLSPTRLVTIRFAQFPAFQAYAEQCKGDERPHSSIEAFIGLMEAIVDATADKLNRSAACSTGSRSEYSAATTRRDPRRLARTAHCARRCARSDGPERL